MSTLKHAALLPGYPGTALLLPCALVSSWPVPSKAVWFSSGENFRVLSANFEDADGRRQRLGPKSGGEQGKVLEGAITLRTGVPHEKAKVVYLGTRVPSVPRRRGAAGRKNATPKLILITL